jgi:hypothetical protein
MPPFLRIKHMCWSLLPHAKPDAPCRIWQLSFYTDFLPRMAGELDFWRILPNDDGRKSCKVDYFHLQACTELAHATNGQESKIVLWKPATQMLYRE